MHLGSIEVELVDVVSQSESDLGAFLLSIKKRGPSTLNPVSKTFFKKPHLSVGVLSMSLSLAHLNKPLLYELVNVIQAISFNWISSSCGFAAITNIRTLPIKCA